jgi:16S rRNA G966 N2-methylase RsmD
LGVSLIRKLAQAARAGTVVIWETENDQNPQFSDELWTVLKDKTYGRARFMILKHN